MIDPDIHDNEPEDSELFDNKFQALLYRWDCPTPSTIEDFHLKRLSRQRRQAVENHLDSCLSCQEELVEFTTFMKLDDLDLEPAKRNDRQRPLFFPSTKSSLSLSLGYARGENDVSRHFILESPDGEKVTILIGLREKEVGYVFSGQFLLDEALESKFQGSAVELWQDATLINTALIDEFGAFVSEIYNLSPIFLLISADDSTIFSCRIDLT